MNDTAGMILALGAGLALGAFYFGGLWLTLQRLPDSPHPALLMLGSYLLRLAVTLAGLYFVMGDSWQRAAACLVGFTVTRIVMARVWRPDGNGKGKPQRHRDTENGDGGGRERQRTAEDAENGDGDGDERDER